MTVTENTVPTAQEALVIADDLCKGSAALRALPAERIAEALSKAVRETVSVEREGAAALRAALVRETALSPAMVEWGLDQLALSFELEAVLALASQARPQGPLVAVPPRLSVVVLSGNVFTAGVRSLALPLLCGSPVLVKTTRAGQALFDTLQWALADVDGEVARHLTLLAFGREDRALSEAIFSRADVVSAYGDDRTMMELRRLLPVSARFLAHGHGVSAAYVPQAVLADPAALTDAARCLALDVAAYDQLGCLSPQVTLVEAGAVPAETFMAALSVALEEIEALLPRGDVPLEAAAQAAQWRGVASVLGQLEAGASHACSVEDAPLRWGPGYRHVAIYPCDGARGAGQLLAPLGEHLKSIGVAGGAAVRVQLAEALPGGLSPRLCALGRMQTPPLSAYFDGRPPFDGLLRFMQLA